MSRRRTLTSTTTSQQGFKSLKSTAQSLQNRSTKKNQKCTGSLANLNLAKTSTMSLQRTMTTTMSFQKSFAASGLQLTACASMQCTTTSSGSAFQQSSCTTSLGMRMRRTMSLRRTLTTSPTTLGASFNNNFPQLPSRRRRKKQLDNLQNAANFYSAASKTKLHNSLGVQLQLRDADSALRGQLMRPLQRASTEACQEYRGFSLAASFRSRIDNQLPRKQLDRRDLQQDSFQDSSSTEETFSKTASKTTSARQLLRQQLGRRELQTGNFSDSSLEDETFTKATSETAAWKKRLSAQQLQRKQLGKGTLP